MVMMSIDIALRALRSPMIMRIEPITPPTRRVTPETPA
jgi:hypothetical protein